MADLNTIVMLNTATTLNCAAMVAQNSLYYNHGYGGYQRAPKKKTKTKTKKPSALSSVFSSKKDLVTPITVPNGPFVPPPRRLAMTAAGFGDYRAREHAASSALVLAGCRLHEATAVVVDSFQRLIYNWSGLVPDEAAKTLKNGMRYPRTTGRVANEDEFARERAVMLQTAVEVATTTDQMAGSLSWWTVVTCRDYAVEAGLLLPLSALAVDSKMKPRVEHRYGYYKSETDTEEDEEDEKDEEDENEKDAEAEMTPTKKTFKEFTRTGGDGTWWRLSDLRERLSTDTKRSNDEAYDTRGTIHSHRCKKVESDLDYRFLGHINEAADRRGVIQGEVAKDKDANDKGTKNGMNKNKVLYDTQYVVGEILSVDLVKSAQTLCHTVDYAYKIAKWRRKMEFAKENAKESITAAGIFDRNAYGGRNGNDDDSDIQLLRHAHKSAKQAVKAAKIARAEYKAVVKQFALKPR